MGDANNYVKDEHNWKNALFQAFRYSLNDSAAPSNAYEELVV